MYLISVGLEVGIGFLGGFIMCGLIYLYVKKVDKFIEKIHS